MTSNQRSSAVDVNGAGVGWLLHRAPGGVVAGVFFVLPSVFVLLGLSYVYAAYGNVQAVAGALDGFKPVVVAIVIDGLALAEMTPGPLIMVLQFIGFMAAWNHPEGMDPTASPVTGASHFAMNFAE